MKTLKALGVIISISLAVTQVFAQGTSPGVWRDGNPVFQSIATFDSVRVDSVISLITISETSEQPDSFELILDGIDWTWPDDENIRVFTPVDIDYRISFTNDIYYLVTDLGGRRVFEVDLDVKNNPPNRRIIWEFKGQKTSDPEYLDRPVDAFSYKQAANDMVLITDQGRNRVIKVIKVDKKIIWQYGDETEGSGFNQLKNPADAIAIPDSGLILICDKGNDRVIFVRESNKSIAWNYGPGELADPVDVEYNAQTQEVLITDQGSHRVIKVDRATSQITWQFGIGAADSSSFGLNAPTDADFLPNGNILICDAGNNRLIEVNQLGQIVWQFKKRLKNLKDADRLLDNKTLAVYNDLPAQLGYSNQDFVSDPMDVGRDAIFDSLFWSGDTTSGTTSIKMQFRTAKILGAYSGWSGPSDNLLYYNRSGVAINPKHTGDRFYQFRAFLETNDPLYTPTLNDVKIKYHYYQTKTTGNIVSEIIRDPFELIITKWKSVKVNTIIPDTLRDRVDLIVYIIDPATGERLTDVPISRNLNENLKDLSTVEKLKKVQAIQLQAILITNSTAVTPIIDSWEVEWEATAATPSSIDFVNENLEAVSFYHLSESFKPDQKFIDRVNVLLNDPNLRPIQDVISLEVKALQSLDSEPANLSLQLDGRYYLRTSLPAIILTEGKPDPNDGFLEVFDRDRLVVSYRDPITPTDQSFDTILVVQDTQGIVRFENKFFASIDTASIGDSIWVRIVGENDQDIRQGQDTIYAVVFDYQTLDRQDITLVEVIDDSGRIVPGEFLSTRKLPLAEGTRTGGDYIIQTLGGSRISVEYNDTISEIPILYILGSSIPPGPRIYSGDLSLDFDVAPNPFYEDRHGTLRIRIASAISDLRVEKIEIYTFAGQRVKEIDPVQVSFSTGLPIPRSVYGFSSNWWDLKGEDEVAVSSGTYWIKVSGNVVNTGESLSLVKKVVIIR
jgi:hypothetical protein